MTRRGQRWNHNTHYHGLILEAIPPGCQRMPAPPEADLAKIPKRQRRQRPVAQGQRRHSIAAFGRFRRGRIGPHRPLAGRRMAVIHSSERADRDNLRYAWPPQSVVLIPEVATQVPRWSGCWTMALTIVWSSRLPPPSREARISGMASTVAAGCGWWEAASDADEVVGGEGQAKWRHLRRTRPAARFSGGYAYESAC
jgi:hypothetical protein